MHSYRERTFVGLVLTMIACSWPAQSVAPGSPVVESSACPDLAGTYLQEGREVGRDRVPSFVWLTEVISQ